MGLSVLERGSMMAVRCVVRLDMYMWSSVIQRGNGCRAYGVPFSIPVAPGVIDHDVRVAIPRRPVPSVILDGPDIRCWPPAQCGRSCGQRRSRKVKRQRRRRCSLRPWSWCQGSDFMPFQTLHHTRFAPEHRKPDFGPFPQKPEGPAPTFRFFTGGCIRRYGRRCA